MKEKQKGRKVVGKERRKEKKEQESYEGKVGKKGR